MCQKWSKFHIFQWMTFHTSSQNWILEIFLLFGSVWIHYLKWTDDVFVQHLLTWTNNTFTAVYLQCSFVHPLQLLGQATIWGNRVEPIKFGRKCYQHINTKIMFECNLKNGLVGHSYFRFKSKYCYKYLEQLTDTNLSNHADDLNTRVY